MTKLKVGDKVKVSKDGFIGERTGVIVADDTEIDGTVEVRCGIHCCWEEIENVTLADRPFVEVLAEVVEGKYPKKTELALSSGSKLYVGEATIAGYGLTNVKNSASIVAEINADQLNGQVTKITLPEDQVKTVSKDEAVEKLEELYGQKVEIK